MAEFYQKYSLNSESCEKLVKKNEYTFYKVVETKLKIPLKQLNTFVIECEASEYIINQLQKDTQNNSCTIWLHHKIL
jgi:hypothetical protein